MNEPVFNAQIELKESAIAQASSLGLGLSLKLLLKRREVLGREPRFATVGTITGSRGLMEPLVDALQKKDIIRKEKSELIGLPDVLL